MLVSDILASKGSAVFSASPAETLADAARLLTEKRIGALIILENGRLAGILSERDIVRALAKKGADSLQQPISKLMTAKVRTCTPGHAIAEVMAIMTESRIRHLPVVEDGQLAGMISIGDVVKWRLEETQEEVRQMTAYVAGGAG